jgi:hypothetical protein
MTLTWNTQVIVLIFVETFRICNYCYEIVGKDLLWCLFDENSHEHCVKWRAILWKSLMVGRCVPWWVKIILLWLLWKRWELQVRGLCRSVIRKVRSVGDCELYTWTSRDVRVEWQWCKPIWTLIGIIQWSTLIGRMDYVHEISVLSSGIWMRAHGASVTYLCMPQVERKVDIACFLRCWVGYGQDWHGFRTTQCWKCWFEIQVEMFEEWNQDVIDRLKSLFWKSTKLFTSIDTAHGVHRIFVVHILDMLPFLDGYTLTLCYSKNQKAIGRSASSTKCITLKTAIGVIARLRCELDVSNSNPERRTDEICL